MLGVHVIQAESEALRRLAQFFPEKFSHAVSLLKTTKGKIICTGMGKSGHVARKIAATFSFVKCPSFFLHPAEALHGDLGTLSSEDVLLIFSNGGETIELLHLLQHSTVKASILITAQEKSTLAQRVDIVLNLPYVPEAPPLKFIPTTSTVMMMALGDALAMTLAEEKKLSISDCVSFHPAGTLKKTLSTVEHAMISPAPLLPLSSSVEQIVNKMSQFKLGCVGLVDTQEKLVKVVYEVPDLLKSMEGTAPLITITPCTHIFEAVSLMQQHQVDVLFVVNEQDKVQGIFCKDNA